MRIYNFWIFIKLSTYFVIAPYCLKVLGKNGSQGPKKEDLQKMKIYSQVFIQYTSVSNFKMIGPFLASLG